MKVVIVGGVAGGASAVWMNTRRAMSVRKANISVGT